MWYVTLICCLFVGVSTESEAQESRLVNTSQGPVRGFKDSELGVYAFLGIPYATAPTGSNRFKAPLPPPVWLQPLDAVDKGIICPQASIPFTPSSSTNFMQEDCLIANLYIPDTEETNLPVVVYVHGGAFQVGWGNMAIPNNLVAEHNIIAINFNYRLGIHGFLCLGTEDAPGNAGMKDQVELLRWVKKNIAYFGGNPDDVTIAGYSAGSASVDLLMLSKSAEGLFKKVIPESGVSTAAFTIQSEPLENAKRYAKTYNFDNVDDVYALEQFYKTSPFELLIKDSFFDRPDSTFVFSPCVERISNEAFLVESPVNILRNGTYKKVPVLHGLSNMEGLLRVGFFDFWKLQMNEKFSNFLPADLKFENEEKREQVAKAVKEFYFGDKPVDEDNILAYVDYFTDVIFTYPALRTVKLMVENGHDQIYLYEYSYVDESTPVVPHTTVRGANHCAQTYAVVEGSIFGFQPMNLTKDFKKWSATVRKLWANFIKTGMPVPPGSELKAWPVVASNWAPHMSLDGELKLQGSLREVQARFWEDIYSKHYRDPQSPPTPPPRS